MASKKTASYVANISDILKTNTTLFTILSTIKWSKFHLSIIDSDTFMVVLFILHNNQITPVAIVLERWNLDNWMAERMMNTTVFILWR